MAKKKAVTGKITGAILVNIRKEPGGVITKTVPAGTEIEVLERGGEWVKVKGGYVRADLIKLPEVENEGLDDKSN